MKKKIFRLFLVALVLSLSLFGFKGTSFAHAEVLTPKEFSVTYSSSDGFSVSGESKATWGEALSYIQTQTQSSEIAKINFSSVTGLSESLELSGSDMILSGNITSDAAQPVFKITSANSFTFSEIEISGAGETLIEVSSETPATLEFSNATFGETEKVLDFKTTGHTVNFAGTVAVAGESTIFADFEKGLNFNVTGSMAEGKTPLKITAPYDAMNLDIIKFSEIFDSYANYFSVVSMDEELYDVVTSFTPGLPLSLRATSTIKFEYDINGGQITASDDYSKTFQYVSGINFLSSDSVALDYNDFDGWFLKYTLSEDEKLALSGSVDSDYLFTDLNSLKSYIENGSHAENMLDYFATDVNGIKDIFGKVTSYSYSAGDEHNFVKFLLDNDKKIILTAKWTPKLYTLHFNSVGGSQVNSMTRRYGETISQPESPTKTGYTFAGWYEDETYGTEFHFNQMPHENKNLFAKWDINNHTLTLHLDGAVYNGRTDTYQTNLDYGSALNLPNLSKEGYTFWGWYTSSDPETQVKVSTETMPDSSLELYAKFEIMVFEVSFVGTNLPSSWIEYGELVEKPENPERAGFIFYNWYSDESCTILFDFETHQIKSRTLIYSRWLQQEYEFNVVLGISGSDLPPQNIAPGAPVPEPQTPTRVNYTFLGWFTDAQFTHPFEFPNVMPGENLTLYAGWRAKRAISLELSAQKYTYNQAGASFKDFSDMDGFVVWYMVDGKWQTNTPTKAGTYDVRIVRAEDSTYASFETVLEDGLVIDYAKKDISLIITGIFILFGMELFAIILLKVMKKRKTSKVYALLPIMVGESTIIPNSQFILLLVACGLTLIGFIYLIYLIVDVHRTAKNESFLPSNLDNRERFKEDLEFQLKNQGDADFETKTKTDETFGEKYSATDIAKLLRNDTFREETLAKRKFNVEDNSSTNWNEVSTNKGSDILAKSKDIGDIAHGRLDNRATVKFFDEDEENPSADEAESPADDEDTEK